MGATLIGVMSPNACSPSSSSEAATASTSGTATASGSGGAGGDNGQGGGGNAPGFCEQEKVKLPAIEFDAKGPYGTRRHDLADDFTVPLRSEPDWTLRKKWTGCEVYVFLTSARSNSELDTQSLWKRDIDQLIAKSPPNVQYFFVAARTAAEAQGELDALQTLIDAALAKDPAKAEFWKPRLHLVSKHSTELDGWLKTMLAGDGRGGFAIDRQQRVRLLGSFADVFRYNAKLKQADKWPWESNLSYASYEVRRYNFEATRNAALAADGATVVSAWKDEVLKYVVEKDVTFPDASAFDTLTIDVDMDCSDPAKGEFGNCGAWDYLAHLYLLDEDGKTWRELARFITTYHREGRYVVDSTPMLVHIGKGGTRKLRYVISPEWNQQAYRSRVDFRFINKKKGHSPSKLFWLWGGGDFNSKYNASFKPVDVDVPMGAKRVELWAIITGHGMATQNCAEFCRHQHELSVNGKPHLFDNPGVGKQDGCVAQVDNGMVPNQGGTWWFGRGGWCPGQQVEPYVADVTADVTPGQKATISYKAMLDGKEPPDGAGNIVMSSWLVVYQ
jgi:hypothetical protein